MTLLRMEYSDGTPMVIMDSFNRLGRGQKSIKAIAARAGLGTYNTANARLHRAIQPGLMLQESGQITGL